MTCKSKIDLIHRINDLSKLDLKIHINDCSICSKNLQHFYNLYTKGKPDPILDSFPPYDQKKSKGEFLDAWIISLASKKERTHHYANELKKNLERDEVKILTINLVQELIKSLKADSYADKRKRHRSLIEIIEILSEEFLHEEFEMLFGYEKEVLLKILDRKLSTKEDNLLPRK